MERKASRKTVKEGGRKVARWTPRKAAGKAVRVARRKGRSRSKTAGIT